MVIISCIRIGGVIIKASDLIGKTVINNKAVEVGKVAEILGITPQKTGRWMKRNMLEFYNEKCFKVNRF